MTFEELKQAVQSQEWDKLKRTPEMQAKYEQLFKDNPNAAEDFEKTHFGGSKIFEPIKIIRNEFPYDLEGCEHFLLLIGVNADDPELEIGSIPVVRDTLCSFLETKRRSTIGMWFVWENPNNRQSVKNLKHFHLVIKN